MRMIPEIIDERVFKLVGCVFYGDPFHSAEEWSYENEIGKLWNRFFKLTLKHSKFFQQDKIKYEYGFEIHIEPDEYVKTKNYYVFVGMELDHDSVNPEFVGELPIELFIKIFPITMYLKFITKVGDIQAGERIFQDWLPKSKYEQSYSYIFQGYHQDRYKGLEDKESEIEWYIPIKRKEKGGK